MTTLATPGQGADPETGPVDDLVYRVLAPNPSSMTLDGTNTYVVGAPGSGEVIVVDPGPRVAAHRLAIEEAARARDAAIVSVVVTHRHADHAEAAHWAGPWGADLRASDPDSVPGAERVGDGDVLRRGGLRLLVIATPGHTDDHLCLRVEDSGVVLAGDHVMGRGTAVISWPDGDLVAYLDSLRRLRATGATRLDPGHGPSLHRPDELIAGYLAHRDEREQQILSAVGDGARTPGEVVAVVYAAVDEGLHAVAERSVRAHLAKLVGEGTLVAGDDLDRVEPVGAR